MNELLIKLFDNIHQYYTRYFDEWNRVCSVKYNLKKMCVKDIFCADNELYPMIIDYRVFLEKYCQEFILQVKQIPGTEVRIKQLNSIDYKTALYADSVNHEYGNIPINKCLNDIMGVRIILEDAPSCGEIDAYIKTHYPKFRVINATREGGYIATHVYYRISNSYFPWELQIWDKRNATNNRISHSKYKQEYTKWEQETIEEIGKD